MPLRAQDCHEGCNRGEGQALGVRGSFFATDWFVSNQSFSHEEPVCRDAQTGVVMESPPTSAFVVPQSEFLLEILVVALDAPALLCDADEFVDSDVLG